MAGYSVTFTVVDQATKQIDAINRRIASIRAPVERMSRTISRFVDVTGLRKVAQGFEWVAKAAMGVVRSLVEIVPLMGTITGAATIAGMMKLVSSYAGWEKQLSITADSLGMTTQEVQNFENAAKLAGGSAADMDTAMQGLYDNANKFVRGQAAPEMQQWMIRLGLNVKDAHGKLKPLSEMMPEFVDRIAKIENPADRAAAANALLGASGDKIVEAFRTAHTTMGQSIEDARQYGALTDEEKRKLEDFQTAQNKLGVTFDTLGSKIAALSSEHLTPLINWFTDFVKQNTPQILQAVGQIEDKFAEWFRAVATWLANPGNWEEIKTDLMAVCNILVKIVDSVKWLIDNSKWMFKTPEELLGLQKNTLNPEAWGKALRDRLGAASGLGQMTPEGTPAPAEEGGGGIGGWWRRHAPTFLGGSPASTPAPGPMNLPTDNVHRGAAIRDRLATDLGLSPEQASGIVGNLQAESGLKAVQEKNPLGGGRGGFGWAQWTGPRRVAFENYAKEQGLDPTSDEANYGFLRQELKSKEYAGMLEKMRQEKTAAGAAATFEAGFERPAVSNAATRGKYAEQYAAAPPVQVAAAAAPPAAVPQPQPVSGNVDVTVTHKNAPPNTSVAATSSGNGVNVGKPRVEYQDFAQI